MKPLAGVVADVFARVRWDFDPVRPVPSPLVPSAVWFAGFPWDGEEADAAQEESGPAGAEDVARALDGLGR